MRIVPQEYADITPRTATSTANAAVSITLAADEDEIHALYAIQCGYSASPSGGTVEVSIGGTVVFSEYVSGANLDFEFPKPLYGDKNQAMVITLSAGGGTAVGKLNVQTS